MDKVARYDGPLNQDVKVGGRSDCIEATLMSATGGGFNSSLQQLDEIVQLVFRSLVSFSGVR